MTDDLRIDIDELKSTVESWPPEDLEVIQELISHQVNLSTLLSTHSIDPEQELVKYPQLDRYDYTNYTKMAELLHSPLVDPEPEGHGYDPPPMIAGYGAIQLVDHYNGIVRGYHRLIKTWNMNVRGNPAAIRNGLVLIPVIPPIVFQARYLNGQVEKTFNTSTPDYKLINVPVPQP